MTQGRAPISSGRYVPVMVNGAWQLARDQVTLRTDILTLLGQHDGLTKKRIIMTLSTAQAAVGNAPTTMLQEGTIECYRAMSARNRLDEHAGQSPARCSSPSDTRYNASAILKAMQQHAAFIHTGSANR